MSEVSLVSGLGVALDVCEAAAGGHARENARAHGSDRVSLDVVTLVLVHGSSEVSGNMRIRLTKMV